MSCSRLVSRNRHPLCYVLFIVCLWSIFNFWDFLSDTNENAQQNVSRQNIYSREEWISMRETAKKKRLVLFCYMRGGSTFFSELFRQNTQAMYFYEPFDAFYSFYFGEKTWHLPQDIFWYQHEPGNSTLRVQTDAELDAMVQFNHHMLTCNFSSLPIEFFFHKGMGKTRHEQFYNCLRANYTNDPINCRSTYIPECTGNAKQVLENRCAENLGLVHTLPNDLKSRVMPRNVLSYADCIDKFMPQVQKCVSILKRECSNVNLVAYKGLRMTMTSLQHMLQHDPGLSVVYLVRDPRGTVLSRVKAQLTYRDTENDPILEAKYLCAKMISDLNIYDRLQFDYPGAILLVKYENLTRYPYEEAKRIYDFIGMDLEPSVLQWMHENAKATNNGGAYSTTRVNATARLNAWHGQVSQQQALAMNFHCSDVLTKLNYEL